MVALGLSQRELCVLTGWSQPKASFICSGKTQYNRDSVTTIARAFGIHPYELLLHPRVALELRKQRADAMHLPDSDDSRE